MIIMLDYKLIEAVAVIAESGSFDKAASALHITQSAISQRLRLLENQLGQILLLRTSPPQLTHAGQEIVKHYLQVQHLESELQEKVTSKVDSKGATLSIAVNADSLATWFLDTVESFIREEGILLDIRVEDQAQTFQLLKRGEVMGSISTLNTSIQGCRHSYIGTMQYHMVASASFARTWFPDGLTQRSTAEAPAIFFNRKDELHGSFLAKNSGIEHPHFPAHYIPSSENFSQYMVAGLGYGLLPTVQSKPLIDSGRLIDLSPGHFLDIQLYWHCWNINSRRLEMLSSLLHFD